MINVYDSNETAFTSNGLVVLSDAISCSVTEELNGVFECTIEYPLDERGKWRYLLEGNIIKADSQLFRIYHKFKSLTSMKVNARHIFYDLLDNLLEDVRPTDLSGYGALDWILTRTQYAHPFTSMGDVGGSDTKYFIRKNPVDAIMGTDGIIVTWGGELVRDNFLIKLLGARGLDRGVLVAYGKNIQGIEETLDTSGICTRLMPVGANGLLLPERYIDSPYINNYPNPKIKVVEISDAETEEALRTAGSAYMVNAKIDIPQFNYKVDFLELSKTEEYKNYAVLERVYLADTVTIKHSKLGIDLNAKVIKTTKNVLTDRLEKVELGSFKPNLATGINNAIQDVQQEILSVKSDYQKAIDNATALITGAEGGNVVIHTDETGKPYEILIMDTTDVMTATNVWRWNLGGFGHSSTGINGPFDTAITQDGSIVASFITGILGKFVELHGGTIIGGTITGATIQTALTGARLVLNETDLTGVLASGYTSVKISPSTIDFYGDGSYLGVHSGTIKSAGHALEYDADTAHIFNIAGSQVLNIGSYGTTSYLFTALTVSGPITGTVSVAQTANSANYANGVGSSGNIKIMSYAFASSTNTIVFTDTSNNQWWVKVDASDKRLKDNISDTDEVSALSKIMAIKHRQFDWKRGGHVDIGYIADEMIEIDPNFAMALPSKVDDEGNEVESMLQIKTDTVMFMMTKAMQEMQREIEKLKEV